MPTSKPRSAGCAPRCRHDGRLPPRRRVRRRRWRFAIASSPAGRGDRPVSGTTVSGFWPLPNEIDPRPLLYHLHARGHPVALPVVIGRGQPLSFRRWRPGLELVSGSFGVLHPGPAGAGGRASDADRALARLRPAGYRLGYGGGFYDRTLTRLRRTGRMLAVGVAFAGQEVADVPPRDDTTSRSTGS